MSEDNRGTDASALKLIGLCTVGFVIIGLIVFNVL